MPGRRRFLPRGRRELRCPWACLPGRRRGRRSPGLAGRASWLSRSRPRPAVPTSAMPPLGIRLRNPHHPRGRGAGRRPPAAAWRGRGGVGRTLPAGGTKARGCGAAGAASRCTSPRSPVPGAAGRGPPCCCCGLPAAGAPPPRPPPPPGCGAPPTAGSRPPAAAGRPCPPPRGPSRLGAGEEGGGEGTRPRSPEELAGGRAAGLGVAAFSLPKIAREGTEVPLRACLRSSGELASAGLRTSPRKAVCKMVASLVFVSGVAGI